MTYISRQPLCELLLLEGFNFILVCKPQSHPTLYEWVDSLEKTHSLHTQVIKRRRGKKTQTDSYRFANQMPLRDGDDALEVNWCEIITTDDHNNIIYLNSFVTAHTITKDNVAEIVEAGRSRFQYENENNNTLKTKGYNLEHNFGHGQQFLSSLLITLNEYIGFFVSYSA